MCLHNMQRCSPTGFFFSASDKHTCADLNLLCFVQFAAARRHGESPFTLWFTAIFGAMVMLVSVVVLASTFVADLFGKNSISTASEGTAMQQAKDGPTIWDGRRQRIIVNGKRINAQNNHVEHEPIAPIEHDTAVVGLDEGISPTSTHIGDGAPPKSPANHDHSTLPGCIDEGNQLQP